MFWKNHKNPETGEPLWPREIKLGPGCSVIFHIDGRITSADGKTMKEVLEWIDNLKVEYYTSTQSAVTIWQIRQAIAAQLLK